MAQTVLSPVLFTTYGSFYVTLKGLGSMATSHVHRFGRMQNNWTLSPFRCSSHLAQRGREAVPVPAIGLDRPAKPVSTGAHSATSSGAARPQYVNRRRLAMPAIHPPPCPCGSFGVLVSRRNPLVQCGEKLRPDLDCPLRGTMIYLGPMDSFVEHRRHVR